MHITHKAGDKMFVDFAGKKLEIIDKQTGEVTEVETFIGVLGASQNTYVEAVASQKKHDWIKANQNALYYFGGVPKAIVPDCLKSAIHKNNKYEPDINPEYADFARHYQTTILPARPNHPKDKALSHCINEARQSTVILLSQNICPNSIVNMATGRHNALLTGQQKSENIQQQ